MCRVVRREMLRAKSLTTTAAVVLLCVMVQALLEHTRDATRLPQTVLQYGNGRCFFELSDDRSSCPATLYSGSPAKPCRQEQKMAGLEIAFIRIDKEEDQTLLAVDTGYHLNCVTPSSDH